MACESTKLFKQEKVDTTAANNTIKSNDDQVNRDKQHIFMNMMCLIVSNSLISFGRSPLLYLTTSLINDTTDSSFLLTTYNVGEFLGCGMCLTPLTKVIKINSHIRFGMICIGIFILAYFYPVFPVLASGYLLAGFGFSLLMPASFAYGSVLAYWYHEITTKDLRILMIVTAAAIYGSLSSGYITGSLLFQVMYNIKSNVNVRSKSDTLCGDHFCGEALHTSLGININEIHFYKSILIFATTSIFGIILAFFLRDISDRTPVNSNKEEIPSWDYMKEIFLTAKSVPSLLLIVISIFTGMQHGFDLSTFTKAFITCTSGISNVGYVLKWYGLTLMTTPFFFWLILKYLGKIVTLIFVYMECLAFLLVLLMLPIAAYNLYLFYILAVLSGTCNSLFLSLSTSSYSVLFPQQIATTQYLAFLWRTVGLFVVFYVNNRLCTNSVIYLQIFGNTFSVVMYLVLEFVYHRTKKTTFC